MDHTYRPIMSFVASARFLIGAVADQLLPHQCLLCGKFCVDRGVCAACWAGAVPISAPLCHRCGRPLPHALPDQLCGQCWRTPPPLAAIRAGFTYNDFSRALILRFKHADGLYLTPVLGRFLARHYAALRQPGNLVIPIPLHRHRYLARRYNQSAELARWLAPADDFAPDILLRRHHNKSQAGLNRAQRQKNVAGIFSVAPESRANLSGRPVMLIDDVMATGATLNAATTCLLAAGSGPVHGLVLARVL
jgi:ComF family protein